MQRYRLEGRAGTQVYTPFGAVACEPLGVHMSIDQVTYLRDIGLDPVAVEEPEVTVELTVRNEDAIVQAQIAEEHRAQAQRAANTATAEAQSVAVPLAATVRARPGRVRGGAVGVPIAGEDL